MQLKKKLLFYRLAPKAKSGLFQNWNREYQNLTGKYTQVDPLGLKGGDFSLYSYAGGNPLKYIDPRGESLGTAVFTATGFGIMIAGTIWLVQDLSKNAIQTAPLQPEVTKHRIMQEIDIS
jgi:RHS repeat-associated protein